MAAITGENINILITATDISQAVVDSSVSGINTAGAALERLQEKMTAQFQNYQALWLRMTVGLAALYGSFRLIEEAAKFEEQKAQLQGLAAQWNTTADAIIAKVKEASDGELSMVQATQLAAKALLYLTPDQLGPFIEAAERLGKVTGKDIPEGFAAFEKAVVTGKGRGLYEALGITVDLDAAVKQYAASLGVSADSLDQQTKMQIRATAALAEAQRQIEMLGPAVENNADRIDKLKAVITDLRLNLGAFLMRVGLAAYGALQWLASGVLNLYSYVKTYIALYREAEASAEQDAEVSAAYSEMAKSVRADADAASQASAATMENAVKYMNAATSSAQSLAAAMRRNKRDALPSFDGKKYDEAAKKQKELDTLMQEIRNRQELSNLSHDERELAAMDQQHEQQIQRLTDLQATQAQIEEATTLMVQERLNLEYTQHVRHLNQSLMESMKRGEEELKLQRQNAEEYLKFQDERYKKEAELLNYVAAYQEQQVRSVLSSAKSAIDNLKSGAGGTNTGIGIMTANMEDILALASERDAASRDIDRAYEHYMQLQEAHIDYQAHQKEIDDAYLQYIKACEDYNIKFQLNTTKSMFGMLSGIAYTIYEMSDKKSKEMFLIYKAFAIVETTISTYMAAVSAFETALEYYEEKTNPYVAAAIAAAYFALTLAAGMARVAMIANQNYEGGSGSVSTAAAGSVTLPTIAEEEESEEEGAGIVEIQLNIYGDVVDQDNTFYLKTVPYLNRIIDSKRTYAVRG